MSDDAFQDTITQARAVVLAWVRRTRPGNYATDDELAMAFCSLLPTDAALELRSVFNPSALIYEARWCHLGREAKDFPKPFCAETEGEARVLACAAMIALPG